MRSKIEPMKRVARMLRTHRPLLLNWFGAKGQFSSGIVEGFNTKAKLTARKSFGFRTYHAMEIALYHALGALPEPELTLILLRRLFSLCFSTLRGVDRKSPDSSGATRVVPGRNGSRMRC